MSVLFATPGNWDDGRLVTLDPSNNQYVCTTIQNGANGIFLYNAANADHDTTVTIVTTNATAPVKVIVPGTTGNQGLAAIVLVNGNVTNTVTISLTSNQPADSKISAFIGSLAFPINTSGINNKSLPVNGVTQNFTAFTRFYAVPASTWYQMNLQSNITQFYAAQFGPGSSAVSIYCVNPGPLAEANIYQADPSNPVSYKFILPAPNQPQQQIAASLFGNGSQFVWINADSIQNSQQATISLQQL
ncbi:hypothetical protein [Nitrosovibrio sp. Nv4]|uniref:hypothetical protein n=1 Tax=Nitrosovibrio sp. Nv4 TaxID=1945880 RepID=UPI000BC7CE15|nr:hypothetical protein [Nitrosovibrio sp. Nv4]SOD39828.1 hypothetical protein SAMN06298226_0058 [Nitrosovibrio sp. Nv4]